MSKKSSVPRNGARFIPAASSSPRRRSVTRIPAGSLSNYAASRGMMHKLQLATHDAIEAAVARTGEKTLPFKFSLQIAEENLVAGRWQSALVGSAHIASDAVWARTITESLVENGFGAEQFHQAPWDIELRSESGYGRPRRHEVKVATPSSNGYFVANLKDNQVIAGNHLVFAMHTDPHDITETKFLCMSMSDLPLLRQMPRRGASFSNGTGSKLLSVSADLVMAGDADHEIIGKRLLDFEEFASYVSVGLR